MDAAPLRDFHRCRLIRFEVMRLLTGKERYPRHSGRHGEQGEREDGIGSGSARRTLNGERAEGPSGWVCRMRGCRVSLVLEPDIFEEQESHVGSARTEGA